ncbi:hypothetical protein R0381_001239 [Jeongeupia wiesaeckerbachi]|uniref:hypothetical protein n=1 Tax=Jeongeupia wiesaeckerbachi TaxID=3051218 RepID=UPI003D807BC4
MINVVLGDEYDESLVMRLENEVRALGGSIDKSDWTLGGSQEVIRYKITIPGGHLEAVFETYVGLSLHGNEHLVMALAKRIVPNHPLQSSASGDD